VIIVMFSILWDLVIDDFGHGIIHNLKFWYPIKIWSFWLKMKAEDQLFKKLQ
jgi:hypothetical protein